MANSTYYYVHSCAHKSSDPNCNAVVVKEQICRRNEDGTETWVPNLRVLKDPVRRFYITKNKIKC